jgi:hypothetical protein
MHGIKIEIKNIYAFCFKISMIEFKGVCNNKMVNDLISYYLELIVLVCISSCGDFKNPFLDFYEIWCECHAT